MVKSATLKVGSENSVLRAGKRKERKTMPHKPNLQDTPQAKFPAISRKAGLQVVHLKGREIFEVEGVLTVEECEAFIEAAEKLKFELQGSRGPAFGEAVRQNGRVALHSPLLASNLWQDCSLRDLFKDILVDGMHAVGLNPNIRFYRYQPGHKFCKHVDESNQVGAAWTKYTLLVYLSGLQAGTQPSSSSFARANVHLKGGETIFYGGRRGKVMAKVQPFAGLALLHLHGDDCHEHEGAVVQAGTKYVLRSDVLFA